MESDRQYDIIASRYLYIHTENSPHTYTNTQTRVCMCMSVYVRVRVSKNIKEYGMKRFNHNLQHLLRRISNSSC